MKRFALLVGIIALFGAMVIASPLDMEEVRAAVWDWVPGSESGISATPTSQSAISVSWGEDYYSTGPEDLYRCSGSGSCTPTYFANVFQSSSYNNTGLSCGTTYRYRVCSDYGCTSIATASTDACTPATPSTPSASGTGQTTMSVTWGAVSGASGYHVYRNSGYIGASGSASYNDSGLSCGTQYGYGIVAYVTTNGRTYYSGTSATGYGSTNACPSVPTPPSGVTATPTSQTTLIVGWTDNSGNETGFKVYSGDGVTPRSTTGANITSVEEGGLSCATSYDKWGVRAYNAVGDSNIAFNTPPSTLDACTPSAPSALSCSPASQSQINCSWTDNSNNPTTNYETGFQVERCSGSGCSGYSLVGSPGQNVTSFSSTGLASGTLYRHRVRAYVSTNGRTYYSGYTAVSDATTDAATPGVPTSVSQTPTGQATVQISWAGGSPSTQTGFRVTDAQGVQDYNSSTFNATGLCSTAGAALSCGTSCTAVNVRAYVDTNGRRYYSNTVTPTAVTLDACTPATPTGVSASAVAANQVNVSWGNVAGETGYKISRCTGSSCSPASYTTKAVDVTSHPDGSLLENTIHRYAVSSYVSTNGREYESDLSTVAQATTQDLAVAITTYSSYVNAANQAAIAVSGTCSGGSGTVSISITSTGGGGPVTASPTCSSGTWSAGSLNLTPLGQGNLTYAATLTVSPNTANASQPGVKDVTAPSVTAPTDGGTWTNNTSLTFSSTPSDTGGSGLSDCTGQIDVNNTDGAGLVFNGSVGTDGDHTFVGTSGNTYYYRVSCTDNAGNSSGYTAWTNGIGLDTGNPSITGPTDTGTWTNNTSLTFSSTPSDTGGSGLSDCTGQIDVNNTDGAGLVFNGSVGTDGDHTFIGTEGNTYYYRVSCTDNASNSSGYTAWTNGIGIDLTAPAFSSKTAACGSWQNTNWVSTFTYTDSFSGIASGNNPTCTISTDGASQTCNVTPNVCDNASNCNTTLITSNTCSVDKTAPTPNPSTGSAASTCAYDAATRSITWTINSSTDVTSGLNSSGYSFTNGSTWQASNQLVESGVTTATTTKTVRARDVADNQTTAGTITAGQVVCIPPPSSAPTSPSGSLDGGQGSVLLSWSEVPDVSGYLIEQSTDGGSTWNYLPDGTISLGSVTTHPVSNYENECPKDYLYRVIAYTTDASSDNDTNCPVGQRDNRKCSAPSAAITAQIRYCTGFFLGE